MKESTLSRTQFTSYITWGFWAFVLCIVKSYMQAMAECKIKHSLSLKCVLDTGSVFLHNEFLAIFLNNMPQ